MKLLKRLGLTLTGLVLSVAPTFATTTDPRTTADLLNLMDESGITVVLDGPRCNQGIDGAYQWTGIARRMVICTHGQPIDANDHNTVRHETIHALQHCKNSILERPSNTPLMEPRKVIEYAEDVLTPGQLASIRRQYPRDVWLIELEAFAGAEVLTAGDLMELFNQLCVMEA